MYSTILMLAMTGTPDLPAAPVGGCRGSVAAVTRTVHVERSRPHLFPRLFGTAPRLVGGCSGAPAAVAAPRAMPATVTTTTKVTTVTTTTTKK